MPRYHTSLQVERRKKIVSPVDTNTVRVALLGIFMILLTFFVALVGNTKHSEKNTIDLIASLRKTFGNTQNDVGLSAIPDVPIWLRGVDGQDIAPPLEELQQKFPGVFTTQKNPWGVIELKFTPATLRQFLFTENELAERIFEGLTTALQPGGFAFGAHQDEYTLEVLIGYKNLSFKEAALLRSEIKQNLDGLGIDGARQRVGYDGAANRVLLRFVPRSHYPQEL